MSDATILRRIQELLREAATLRLDAKAIRRLTWLRFHYAHGGNVSLTCRHFCIGRSTLLRWLRRFDPDNIRSLEERSRSPHRVRRPEIDPCVVTLIERYRRTTPLMGKTMLAELLRHDHGMEISPSSVGRVIERHCFYFADSPLHRRKRRARGREQRRNEHDMLRSLPLQTRFSFS